LKTRMIVLNSTLLASPSPAAAPRFPPVPAQRSRIRLRHQRRQRHRHRPRRRQHAPRPRTARRPQPRCRRRQPHRNEVYVVKLRRTTGQGSLSVINAEKQLRSRFHPLQKQPSPSTSTPTASSPTSQLRFKLHLRRRSRQTAANRPGRRRRGACSLCDSPRRQTLASQSKGNSLSSSIRSLTVRSVFAAAPAPPRRHAPDSSKAIVNCSTGHQVMAPARQGQQTRLSAIRWKPGNAGHPRPH